MSRGPRALPVAADLCLGDDRRRILRRLITPVPSLLVRARLDFGCLRTDAVELLEHRPELPLELLARRRHADSLGGSSRRREDAPEALKERRHARHEAPP